MACPSKKQMTQIVPISRKQQTHTAITSPVVKKASAESPVRHEANRVIGVEDFYCPTCGLTRFNLTMPYDHKCVGRRIYRSFVQHRERICSGCEHNIDGVCELVKAKHPDREGLIEVGCRQFSSRCPKNRWLATKINCPRCESILMDVDGVSSCTCGWKGMGRQVIWPRPFTSEPVRHLHYFMYPRQPEMIRFHLDQLRKSIHLFNGRRLCCVATDTHTIETSIKPDLGELFTEVRYVTNNPSKQEMVGFITGFEMLESRDPNELICYAHAKGQKHDRSKNPAVRAWSEAMYEHTVQNYENAQAAMEEGYAAACSFRIYDGNGRWHPSGNFWWIRSEVMFRNKNWRAVEPSVYGGEKYLGKHFEAEEVKCLYGEDVKPYSLYSDETWEVPWQ